MPEVLVDTSLIHGRPARRPRATVARLLVAAALTLGTIVPASVVSSADAASYSVWSCRAADGTPIGTTAWRGSGTAGTRTDDCATGGALRASLGPSDIGDGAISGWQFTAPPGTTIERYRLWRAAATSATASGFAAGTAGSAGLGVPTFNDGCIVGPGCSIGDPIDPDGAGNAVDIPGPVLGVTVAASCTSAACSASTDPPASVALFRSAVDLTDNVPPVVGPAVGTLLDPNAFAGRHSLLAPVADQGSGVARTDLVIDGAVVQSVPTGGTCVPPYAVAVPCATYTDRGFVVDTSGLADGTHTVVVRAVDAAGNVADGPAAAFVVRRPLIVPPPPPPPPPPAPTQRAMQLALPKKASLPRKRWSFGVARWADGSPAAGVRLDVYAGPVGAAADELEWLKRITVAADGSFTLPKSSFSRALRVQPADAAHVATPADVDVVARLRVRMRKPSGTVRNGRTTTLRGTISGAGDAVDGMTVLVQAIVNGRWSTVDSVEASESGAVKWKYRFRRTVRTAKYRFRLVVPSVRSLPWKRTASPRRIVRVVPRTARR